MKPAQPLYDVLPSPPAGADDFALRTSAENISVPKGRSGTTTVTVTRRGNFRSSVSLSVSGLPLGLDGLIQPSQHCKNKQITLTADDSSSLGTSTITITGYIGRPVAYNHDRAHCDRSQDRDGQ